MEVKNKNFSQKTYQDIHNSIDLDECARVSDHDSSDFQALINPLLINNISNKQIVTWINELHKSLDTDHEAGIKIDHAGEQIIFHIDHIGHANPSMIYFKGYTESGDLVHFVKHQSQLNIELLKLKRRTPNTSKNPYGFTDWEAYEKNKYNKDLD